MSRIYHRDISQEKGQLSVFAYEGFKSKPIPNAKVSIYGNIEGRASYINTLTTDNSGQTPYTPLSAPDKSLTLNFTNQRPYSQYSIIVESEGYNPVEIEGVQVFDSVKSIQDVQMTPIVPARPMRDFQKIIIPDHTLYGNYPSKIPETPSTFVEGAGEIMPIFAFVIIPEFVQVHNGTPDSWAQNYTVPYKDYIKNVACSEIYPTWHKEAIKANVICIVSFTLNRIYTEFYRSKGFTITSSTQYDHAYVHGRTIYPAITEIVDEIFDNYIYLPTEGEGASPIVPFLAQYSRGIPNSPKATHNGWSSQYGSQYLAEKEGYTHEKILKYYYSKVLKEVKITDFVEELEGVPETYPGHVLKIGSSENAVKTIQNQLNVISKNYPAIPKLKEDGVFDTTTEKAVKVFQKVASLTQDGIVGRSTWYSISNYYVAVKKYNEGVRIYACNSYTPQYVSVPYVKWTPAYIPVIKYVNYRIK